MLSEISSRFPEVMPALIHERDVYLAWSLTRSKAVNGSHSVVGVIGRCALRSRRLMCNQDKLTSQTALF